MEGYPTSKVSVEAMNSLSTSKDFSTWAGPKVLSAIKRLETSRRTLLANSAVLGTHKYEALMATPEVKEYQASADAIGKSLEQKFGISEKDNGVSCD